MNSRFFMRQRFYAEIVMAAVLTTGIADVARSQDSQPQSRPGFLSHNVSLPSEATLAIPTQWTPESVKWHAKVAGYGQSTPVVYDSVAYVTSVQGENKDSYFLEAFSIASVNDSGR